MVQFVGFFYVLEHLKAQSAVVLILKCLRRRSHGLKSDPTDWEKLGIELAIPGLQCTRHGFIPYTTKLKICSMASKYKN